MYGATPIEDITSYNQIVRSLTEWTNQNIDGTITQQSINEGIGGYVSGKSGSISSDTTFHTNTAGASSGLNGLVNVRQSMIQGVSTVIGLNTSVYPNAPNGMGFGVVPFGTTTITPTITGLTNADLLHTTNPIRRYQVNLALGLLNQPKLIPTKFMASQLSIEIVLANPEDCIYAPIVNSAGNPTYQISNVNLIPEILEFDAFYDRTFLRGMMNGGVPIKFSSWNNYKYSVGNVTTINLTIQDRSRSLKAVFAMLKRDPPLFVTDSGATFLTTGFNANVTPNGGGSTLQEHQFRIGGRYK